MDESNRSSDRSSKRSPNPSLDGSLDDRQHTKPQELRAFLFLSVVLAPMLAVALVTGYGFLVWMYQLLAGPPGPMH